MPSEYCDHIWIAGGLQSDWICVDCGFRADIPDIQLIPPTDSKD